MTTQQAFQIALQHHQAGRLREAEALYRQILAVEPRDAEAFHMLGVIAAQTGRNDLAEDLIRQAIALKPNYPEAHNNLGNALKAMGKFDEAIATYRRAIALKPNYPEAYNNLGNALFDQGQVDAAIAACRQAIALKPNYPEAHSNLGNALKAKGELNEAIAAYRRAIALRPSYPEAHSNLGIALFDQGQLDAAIAAFGQAIALKPDLPEAHSNLGNVLKDKGQLDEAIAAYGRAIALMPNDPDAHYNLGIAMYDKGHLDEAIAACRQAIDLRPNYPEAQTNLGAALQAKGQLAEAIAACRQAIALKPNSPEAHYNLSLAMLAQGNFLRGWEEYEFRWKLKELAFSERHFAQPKWDGSPLEGRTILLHGEQGLGDTLQFVRYAPLVAERGGRVILECQPGLSALLASAAGVSQIITRREALPAFDLHCPLMSLPRAFGTRLETIPADIPYLRADAQKAARWRERLDGENSGSGEDNPWRCEPLKVGLVWAGASRPHQPNAHVIDRRRSMRLSQFAPLAEVSGALFFSLQKGGPAEQAQTPPAGMRLLDWTSELEDFADTAAFIESLDLVISVDTSVAHLAGALGKPVWVLNRFDTCWRWLRDRPDSPWYPTLRLFRQRQLGEWESVIVEVREQLQLLVESRSGKP